MCTLFAQALKFWIFFFHTLKRYLFVCTLLNLFHQVNEESTLVRIRIRQCPYPVPPGFDFEIKLINPSSHGVYYSQLVLIISARITKNSTATAICAMESSIISPCILGFLNYQRYQSSAKYNDSNNPGVEDNRVKYNFAFHIRIPLSIHVAGISRGFCRLRNRILPQCIRAYTVTGSTLRSLFRSPRCTRIRIG